MPRRSMLSAAERNSLLAERSHPALRFRWAGFVLDILLALKTRRMSIQSNPAT